jgi:peroxiredoxin
MPPPLFYHRSFAALRITAVAWSLTPRRRMRTRTFLPLLLVVLAACPGDREPEVPLGPEGVEAGNTAPVLQGQLPDGSAFQLEGERGRRTVLVFYRSEACGLCRMRLEQLNENLSAYSAAGGSVLAVTLDPPPLVARTQERLGSDLSIVSVDSATFTRWGLLPEPGGVPLPGAYVLDERRQILYRHRGEHAGDRIGDATLLTILETHR